MRLRVGCELVLRAAAGMKCQERALLRAPLLRMQAAPPASSARSPELAGAPASGPCSPMSVSRLAKRPTYSSDWCRPWRFIFSGRRARAADGMALRLKGAERGEAEMPSRLSAALEIPGCRPGEGVDEVVDHHAHLRRWPPVGRVDRVNAAQRLRGWSSCMATSSPRRKAAATMNCG